jgi:hypothetical protein
MQHETQRPVQFEITQAARDAVQKWIKTATGGHVAPVRTGGFGQWETLAPALSKRTFGGARRCSLAALRLVHS